MMHSLILVGVLYDDGALRVDHRDLSETTGVVAVTGMGR